MTERENRVSRALDRAGSAATEALFPTAWARSAPARALREVVQSVGLRALLSAELSIDVGGLDRVADVDGPVVLVANHASHLDTAVILCTLPPALRRRTAVAAAADYFFDTWWRASSTAIIFNTFPLERRPGSASRTGGVVATPSQLLGNGWSVLVYPEGTRSADGFMGRFRLGAAWLAVDAGVPVIPIGLRGTYAAMPKGRTWPVPGRPRVSIRYGRPIVPAAKETARDLAPKLVQAVRQLIEEDASTWWETQRHPVAADQAPPAGSWRRIWQQTAPPREGGRPERAKIWRGQR